MTAPVRPMIIGAGLSGLLAAHAWPNARVVEASPEPRPGHSALLRFRGEEVSKLTGIEFRRVRVRKGIWSEGGYCPPSIRLANQYSLKVLGAVLGDRSIWNLEAVDRWIAPETFYAQLLEGARGRVEWGYAADLLGWGQPLISTIPLPAALNHVGLDPAPLQFSSAPITVLRGRVLGADVFQTVYFPDLSGAVYRASITGDLLIVEFAGSGNFDSDVHVAARSAEIERLVLPAFALTGEIDWLPAAEQKYGKVAPIPDRDRRELIYRLTRDHRIYSLGRFATWRNVLLDDVVNDIAMIKRLLRATDYERRVAAS